jgi:anti-sigma B factor antagonist
VADFSLDAAERDNHIVLAVKGDVDAYTAPRLRELLIEFSNQPDPHIVVDLNETDFLDSTGIGVLVMGVKLVRSQQGDFKIACNRNQILKLLDISGISQLLPVFESVDAAVQA